MTKNTKTKRVKKAKENLPVEGLSQYELIFKVNGEEQTTLGNTLEEAFNKIQPPQKYGTKGVLTVRFAGKETTRLFIIPQMKRMFGIGGMTTQKIAVESTLKFIKLMIT